MYVWSTVCHVKIEKMIIVPYSIYMLIHIYFYLLANINKFMYYTREVVFCTATSTGTSIGMLISAHIIILFRIFIVKWSSVRCFHQVSRVILWVSSDYNIDTDWYDLVWLWLRIYIVQYGTGTLGNFQKFSLKTFELWWFVSFGLI